MEEKRSRVLGRPRREKVGHFGKWLKIFCVERDMAIKDVASAMNYSAVYLVRLERADKIAPAKFITRLVATFDLTHEERASLREACSKDILTNISRREYVRFDMTELSNATKRLLGRCMSLLPFLSESETSALLETLEGYRGNDRDAGDGENASGSGV